MTDGIAGTQLGPYRVERELARGGQGAVYQVQHTGFNTRFALKILLNDDPKSVRRFRQEGQVLARLEHPNLLKVSDQGELNGWHFLAMEFVDGQDLKALVKSGSVASVRWAVETVATVARALHWCHERGIVHRDMKPANVLIENGTGRAVVVDFGLLHRDSDLFGSLSDDQRSKLSVTGEAKGTPSYMPPEQADRSFGEVGPLSDVYSLGATLYYLLTGEPPYRGSTVLNVLHRVLDPVRLPTNPRKLNPQIPAPVAALCLRAMSKSPAGRPRSAEEFARQLEGTLQENAIGATDPLDGELRYVPTPRAALGPRSLLAGSVVICGLIGIALVASRVVPSEPPPKQVAPPPRQVAQPPNGTTPAETDPIELSRQAAEAGDVASMVALADALFNGTGVEKDKVSAALWYRKAALAGDTSAMTSLGAMYVTGSGLKRDSGAGVVWLQRAADAGNAPAMNLLGTLHFGGHAVKKDNAKAAFWLRRSAEAGNVDGMLNLANFQLNGLGVKKDAEAAAAWYRKAVAKGDSKAMVVLALLYLRGRVESGDDSDAAALLKDASNADNLDAHFNLALLLSVGRGIEKDPQASNALLRKAAEGGHSEAMRHLALAYALGQGVRADPLQAAELYKKAIDMGNADAITDLGVLYQKGLGLEKDSTKAVSLFRRAAQAGVPLGMANLAFMLQEGLGVEKDPGEAVRWYRAAEAKGHTDSREDLETLLHEHPELR